MRMGLGNSGASRNTQVVRDDRRLLFRAVGESPPLFLNSNVIEQWAGVPPSAGHQKMPVPAIHKLSSPQRTQEARCEPTRNSGRDAGCGDIQATVPSLGTAIAASCSFLTCGVDPESVGGGGAQLYRPTLRSHDAKPLHLEYAGRCRCSGPCGRAHMVLSTPLSAVGSRSQSSPASTFSHRTLAQR